MYLRRSFLRKRAIDEALGWLKDRGQTVDKLFGGHIYDDAMEHAARMRGCEVPFANNGEGTDGATAGCADDPKKFPRQRLKPKND